MECMAAHINGRSENNYNGCIETDKDDNSKAYFPHPFMKTLHQWCANYPIIPLFIHWAHQLLFRANCDTTLKYFSVSLLIRAAAIGTLGDSTNTILTVLTSVSIQLLKFPIRVEFSLVSDLPISSAEINAFPHQWIIALVRCTLRWYRCTKSLFWNKAPATTAAP